MERQLEKILEQKDRRSNYEHYQHKNADVEILMEAMFAIREKLKEQKAAVKRVNMFCTWLKIYTNTQISMLQLIY